MVRESFCLLRQSKGSQRVVCIVAAMDLSQKLLPLMLFRQELGLFVSGGVAATFKQYTCVRRACSCGHHGFAHVPKMREVEALVCCYCCREASTCAQRYIHYGLTTQREAM